MQRQHLDTCRHSAPPVLLQMDPNGRNTLSQKQNIDDPGGEWPLAIRKLVLTLGDSSTPTWSGPILSFTVFFFFVDGVTQEWKSSTATSNPGCSLKRPPLRRWTWLFLVSVSLASNHNGSHQLSDYVPSTQNIAALWVVEKATFHPLPSPSRHFLQFDMVPLSSCRFSH